MIQWNLTSDPLVEADMVVTLDELKAHLWIIGIDADDNYIKSLCLTAMSYLESQLSTSLKLRPFVLTFDRFPYFWVSYQQMIPMMSGILVPMWPLVSVTSMTYSDSLTGLTNIDVTTLQLRKYKPPSIFPKIGSVWPWNNPQSVADVNVTFTAGYADPSKVPHSLKHLVKLLVGHWYKNRESAQQALLQPMPWGIDELIRNEKWWW